jgi:hypothetical protein
MRHDSYFGDIMCSNVYLGDGGQNRDVELQIYLMEHPFVFSRLSVGQVIGRGVGVRI